MVLSWVLPVDGLESVLGGGVDRHVQLSHRGQGSQLLRELQHTHTHGEAVSTPLPRLSSLCAVVSPVRW